MLHEYAAFVAECWAQVSWEVRMGRRAWDMEGHRQNETLEDELELGSSLPGSQGGL